MNTKWLITWGRIGFFSPSGSLTTSSHPVTWLQNVREHIHDRIVLLYAMRLDLDVSDNNWDTPGKEAT